jgi:threonine/homoserine/homoserine lactone efflux protein
VCASVETTTPWIFLKIKLSGTAAALYTGFQLLNQTPFGGIAGREKKKKQPLVYDTVKKRKKKKKEIYASNKKE